MSKNKMSITSLYLLFLLICSSFCSQIEENPSQIIKKVVEVEPVALQIILSIYERAVVYFTPNISSTNVKLYEEAVKKLLIQSQPQIYNQTLFAICDISKDMSGKLKKYGSQHGIQIITPITNYVLNMNEQSQNEPKNYFEVEFPKFIESNTISSPQIINHQQFNKNLPSGYLLTISSLQPHYLPHATKIYRKLIDFLNFFNTKFVLVNGPGTQVPQINLHHNGILHSSYPKSAVQALFNFTLKDGPAKNQINDLVDFINIQTIDDVTELTDGSYYRVYGSLIDHQILFIYRQNDKNNEDISKTRKQFKQAAVKNRKQGLKYQRVLFAQGTVQFLNKHFADQTILSKNNLYSIMITKTDYSSFQLRKYSFDNKEVTSQNILKFIDDVKMKRLDATFKSEQIQNNDNKKIRKIVGNNFYHQIFQQPQKSVMVLFIDSKDPQSYAQIHKIYHQFVEKYNDAYKQNMHAGIFDLAKNQHKSLTISTAPQVILFERSNKKKPKFFKGKPSLQSFKNWVNYQVKDFTIPQNFGEPPIALGVPSSQQL